MRDHRRQALCTSATSQIGDATWDTVDRAAADAQAPWPACAGEAPCPHACPNPRSPAGSADRAAAAAPASSTAKPCVHLLVKHCKLATKSPRGGMSLLALFCSRTRLPRLRCGTGGEWSCRYEWHDHSESALPGTQRAGKAAGLDTGGVSWRAPTGPKTSTLSFSTLVATPSETAR